MDPIEFVLNNGIGVFFGWLLYRMATTSIEKNTNAINKLTKALVAGKYCSRNDKK